MQKKFFKKLGAVFSSRYRRRVFERFISLKESSNKKIRRNLDEEFVNKFLTCSDFRRKYELLFAYFVTGADTYKSKFGSRIYFPGLFSSHGSLVDGLEGFSRTAPLISSWLFSKKNPKVKLLNEKYLDLEDFIHRGIMNGVNPNSKGYWGDIANYDQRVVEAHDIAISVWLLLKYKSDFFSSQEVLQISEWLSQVNKSAVYDNNWNLFICVINAVLLDLGCSGSSDKLQNHFGRIKACYLGGGWFEDGVGGKVDYYNVWGFQYSLFWMQFIKPEFERGFICEARQKFIESYRLFLSPCGAPLFGRSLIYRLAVSFPFLSSAYHNEICCGEAKRAFDSSWNFYVEKGCLKAGGFTQGIFSENLNVLDYYSSGSSSLWGLRSLIALFLFPSGHEIWDCETKHLAVEQENYSITIPEVGWNISGNNGLQVVELSINDKIAGKIDFKKYSWRNKFKNIFCVTSRVSNDGTLYELEKYSSDPSFQDEIFGNYVDQEK